MKGPMKFVRVVLLLETNGNVPDMNDECEWERVFAWASPGSVQTRAKVKVHGAKATVLRGKPDAVGFRCTDCQGAVTAPPDRHRVSGCCGAAIERVSANAKGTDR